MRISRIDPALAGHLIKELDSFHASLYPPESNHLDSIETLRESGAAFFGAWDGDEIIAMGAVKFFADYGEIKRVYVPERHRGKGLAKKIMDVLETELSARGILWAKLETGPLQPEALGLYERLGYEPCGPFGEYRLDPFSVFMQKRLRVG